MLGDILFFISLFWAAPVPSGVGWQKDNIVQVAFVTDPNEVCGPAEPGGIILACTDKIGGKTIVLPNPCKYKDNDAYARVVCHELAHTNGWRHEYR